VREGQIVKVPACPVCGGGAFSTLADYPEFSWVTCTDCSLIYKRSESEAVASDYEEAYFGEGAENTYDKRTARRVSKSKSQILDVLNHVPPGPLLDIGCSLGYTLKAGRELGLEASGTDISEFAIKACREQGFAAELGLLDKLPFADDAFGVVTMKHVLEHTRDPRAALAEVHRVLKPGAGLFIAVPDGRYHKAVKNPKGSKFYRPDTMGGVDHFIYYTPQTLTRLVNDSGFKVVRVHPHLLHRKGSAGELLTAPFRALWGAIAEALHLRKEFWLTAVAI
jgi:ubiquinone/menaquinone biosynthesis C-methylase UbiE